MSGLADRSVVAWMLGALVATFLVTRVITRLIHAGRGPFRDLSVGGVHLHHQVFGIFLLLLTGAFALVFGPSGGWLDGAAALFGVGAALALDEFALWLHLDDVYWSPEGRRSIDAVLMAVVIGLMLLAGLSPFEEEPGIGQQLGAVVVGINLVFSLVAIVKGRTLMGVLGMFVPIVAWIVAFRLARPRSPWARRFYAVGSRQLSRAQQRFPAGRRNRWDPLVDLLAGPIEPER